MVLAGPGRSGLTSQLLRLRQEESKYKASLGNIVSESVSNFKRKKGLET